MRDIERSFQPAGSRCATACRKCRIEFLQVVENPPAFSDGPLVNAIVVQRRAEKVIDFATVCQITHADRNEVEISPFRVSGSVEERT